jgi:hypothetical protein
MPGHDAPQERACRGRRETTRGAVRPGHRVRREAPPLARDVAWGTSRFPSHESRRRSPRSLAVAETLPRLFSLKPRERGSTNAPRPSVERFAKAVVHDEVARGGARTDLHVAQRIMVRLHQALGKLVGPAGFDVLLARALVLARRVHASLAGVAGGPGGTLTGLDDAASADGQEEAATAIVSHFIELLVTLIGEDLAMRLLGDLWPAANEEEGPR